MIYKKTFKKKKFILISKDTDVDHIRQAKEAFESPVDYLNINSEMVIGTSPLPKVSLKSKRLAKQINKSNSKLTINSQSCNSNSSKSGRPSRRKNRLSTNRKKSESSSEEKKKDKYTLNIVNKIKEERKKRRLMSLLKMKKEEEEKKKRPKTGKIGIHYNYKNKNQINNFFNECQYRQTKSLSKGTSSYINNRALTEIKDDYIKQEKILNLFEVKIKKDEKTSKYLSQKCNNKEKKLLFNNIEHFRLKKQFINFLEKNKNLKQKYGDYYWMFNLRRPEKLDFTRINPVPHFSQGKEIWKDIIDFKDQDLSFIRNPNNKYATKFYDSIKKDNNLLIEYKFKNDIYKPKIKEVSDLQILGRNLLKEEKKIFEKYENKFSEDKEYKIFKDPYEEKKEMIKTMVYKQSYSKK